MLAVGHVADHGSRDGPMVDGGGRLVDQLIGQASIHFALHCHAVVYKLLLLLLFVLASSEQSVEVVERIRYAASQQVQLGVSVVHGRVIILVVVRRVVEGSGRRATSATTQIGHHVVALNFGQLFGSVAAPLNRKESKKMN